MRKYLLPEQGQFYKANLHCHTTVSDGKKTPEEVKELYMSKGYSIVAYTDHEVFITHNDLTDESFLALNGFEASVEEKYGRHSRRSMKLCHICYIALDENEENHPVWSRDVYLWGNAVQYRETQKFDESEKDYNRSYTTRCVSEMMQIGREKGFFVTYNHPTWSRENYEQYSKYHGMHAMEIMNGSSNSQGHEEYNPRVYDDILRNGNQIFCIGADDNHNLYPDDSRRSDSGRAWTVIKADKLEYAAVADALVNGHFYTSDGPEIYELYIEDDKIHIKCSAADSIFCTYGKRTAAIAYAEKGEQLTEAIFDYKPNCGYFRITVKDKHGNHACSNAYFPE